MACCADSIKDVKSRKLWTAVVAEFLGTMILVLIGCGSCMPARTQSKESIALAFGLAVASVVWAIGRVSGGHINPAVTFGFLATRKISCLRALFYMIAQIAGAFCGAGLLKALMPAFVPVAGKTIDPYDTLGSSLMSAGVSQAQAFGIEFLITFIFVFVILASCDPDRKDLGGSIPLAIGLTLAACHLFAVPFTGSGMNPARSLGPAVISGHLENHWVYWVGPMLGGLVGARLYDVVFAVNATPTKCKGQAKMDYDDRQYDQDGRKPEVNAHEGDELKPV